MGGSSATSLLRCLLDLLPFLWLPFVHFLPFIVVLCQWSDRYLCYSTTLAALYPRDGSGAWGTVGHQLIWTQDRFGLTRLGGGRKRGGKREPSDRLRKGWLSYVTLRLCPLVPAGLHYPAFSSEQLGDGCRAAGAVGGEQRGGIWAGFQTSTLGHRRATAAMAFFFFFFLNKCCCFVALNLGLICGDDEKEDKNVKTVKLSCKRSAQVLHTRTRFS